jgi:hypothetical protein
MGSAMALGARYLRSGVDPRLAERKSRRTEMTLCPVALAVGCKKCPVFTVCPLKGVIGDYRKEDATEIKPPPDPSKP